METAVETQASASLPKERITAKVRAAVDAMVWQGLQRKYAAESAGLAEHSLYQALRRPPVRQYYLSQLEVLRNSERARNIHALVDVRDNSGNQAARVAAVNSLEGMCESAGTTSAARSAPGVTIVIQGNASVAPQLEPVTLDNEPA